MANSRAEFRESVESDGIVVAPGAYDAASAKLVERAGAEVVYMSGSSVSTSVHGYPDVGVTTLTEMTDRARQMANAVDVPVFADADTGYGNPINVRRTVEEFEAAGVAGVHLEDQTFPKQCGHFEGKDVVATDEMTAKLRAAADAREDDDFVLIARTDARAVEGFDVAVERSRAYLEAGADVIFFEAPESVAELEEAAERIDAPLLANMTEGGKTPMLSAEELDALGYDIALFPATGFKAVLKTLQDVYAEIVETGSQREVMDELVTWEGRNEITGLDRIRDLEDRYATDGDS
ncbi:oxaloacetate decarboxylase [Halorussus sp. MSC15.2]|uniref:isocitrate lyase/PEP mutase family protein n=1 Tax=Halorussus sp. MSC15.2 TaxID=2283638 RepID=UPI0013D184F6|nr:isocitrate lyase/phosphoenolpyruvate mutase family protein [Halorussus sp. MSC15.2]NEU58676.1 carboxyvinyl-carboxyphosphonate phosphorylmutase [Halorussus sp. MSC15.2]